MKLQMNLLVALLELLIGWVEPNLASHGSLQKQLKLL